MLHNDAVRLAKISVEKFQNVALIPAHILHYRSHMNDWSLETIDFVDFLLCCIQNAQNRVAEALVPVFSGPECDSCHGISKLAKTLSVIIYLLSCHTFTPIEKCAIFFQIARFL